MESTPLISSAIDDYEDYDYENSSSTEKLISTNTSKRRRFFNLNRNRNRRMSYQNDDQTPEAMRPPQQNATDQKVSKASKFIE